MPANYETRVEGEFAFVEPIEAGGTLNAAISAARDASVTAEQSRQIRTFTGRRGLGIRLPRELAQRAGLIDGSTSAGTSAPAPSGGQSVDPRTIAEPPRSGSGFGFDTWRGFLLTQSVAVDPSITRAADLRTVWDASPQKAARTATS